MLHKCFSRRRPPVAKASHCRECKNAARNILFDFDFILFVTMSTTEKCLATKNLAQILQKISGIKHVRKHS